MLDTHVIPGALELLEAGELNESEPRLDDVARAGGVRLGQDELGDLPRWRAFLDRLRGYRRDEVLIDGEVTWLPLVELVPPKGGRASCTRKVTKSDQWAMDLKVLGTGFGSSLRAVLVTEVSFDAEDTSMALATPVRLTAVRYVHDRAPALVRVDVRDAGEHLRLEPIAAETPLHPMQPPLYEVIQRIELSRVAGIGTFIWKRGAEEDASWSWSLGAALPCLGDVSATVEVHNVRNLEVRFELPYGRDYVMYWKLARSRLIPRCAVL